MTVCFGISSSVCLDWELNVANALSEQKRRRHCLGDWLDVSQHVPGVLQDKPGGCLLTGRNGWYLLGGFCPPHFLTSLPNLWVPKEEPVPAVVWEGEEGEGNKPHVLVSVTV